MSIVIKEKTLYNYIIDQLGEVADISTTSYSPAKIKSFLLDKFKGKKLRIPDLGKGGNDYGNYIVIDDNFTITTNNGPISFFRGTGEKVQRGNYLCLDYVEYPITYVKDSIEDYQYRIKVEEGKIEKYKADMKSLENGMLISMEKRTKYHQIIELIKEKGKECISEEDYTAYKSLVS